MAHAVEALYAEDANPIIGLMAEESIRSLAQALPRVVEHPADREARGQALYGAWLAGVCLGSVGMAIHHKLCHTLGGTFNLPHAQAHAVVLPHAAHYNREAAASALARVARVLGGSAAEEAGPLLFALNRRLGVPASLGELGLPPEGPAEVARIACASPITTHVHSSPWPSKRCSSARATDCRRHDGEAGRGRACGRRRREDHRPGPRQFRRRA